MTEEKIRRIAREEIRAHATDTSAGSQLLRLTRAITLAAESISREEISRFARLLAAELDISGLTPEHRAVQNALRRFDEGQEA